jgi:hypothetical protein
VINLTIDGILDFFCKLWIIPAIGPITDSIYDNYNYSLSSFQLLFHFFIIRDNSSLRVWALVSKIPLTAG